jgi:hypothetical protein
MARFTFTITGVLEGESSDELWEDWIELLSNPAFIEDGTVIKEDDET